MQKRYILYVNQAYSFSILQPIYNEIVERGDSVYWYLTPHIRDSCKVIPISKDNKVFTEIKDVINYNPLATITSENTVCDFFPGVKVQVFHGIITNKRSEQCRDHFKLRGFFDLYCTPGPSCTKPFQDLEKRHNYFKVVETGWPKFDHILNRQESKREIAGVPTVPTILFASTFTKQLTSAPHLLPIIKQIIKEREWNWICTFHPKMSYDIVDEYRSLEGDKFRYIEPGNSIPLLHQADIMLSDSSSIIAEFLALDKPVVTYKNSVPGEQLINFTDRDKLESNLERALAPSLELMQHIKEYNKSLHPYKDMKSSARVLDAIDHFIANDLGKMGRRPLNLFRKYKIRTQLRCFPEIKPIK